jgi:hypothetical protein
VSKQRPGNARDARSHIRWSKLFILEDDSCCEPITFLRELKVDTQKKLRKQNLILDKNRHLTKVPTYNVAFCLPTVVTCFTQSNSTSLAQRRTKARLCALFKAYCGERTWKVIRESLRRAYCLSRVDHVRKIRDRKQRTDIEKYSFVNRTIKNWNQLLAEGLGTFPCKPEILGRELGKQL